MKISSGITRATFGALDFSVQKMGGQLHQHLSSVTRFRPREVRDFLLQNEDGLRNTLEHARSIEDRGLACAWLRFTATLGKLTSGLRESPMSAGSLEDLWTEETLEEVDAWIADFLKRLPRYAPLLNAEARHQLHGEAMAMTDGDKHMTLDEMRALIMHTHAQRAFFELHTFVQRAGHAGLTSLSKRFDPQLAALQGAYRKLMRNGHGVQKTLHKALVDNIETQAFIERLQRHGATYMPLSSWGDTTYSFIDRRDYSCVLQVVSEGVDVTHFGQAFMRHGGEDYKEYLVPPGFIELHRVGQWVTRDIDSRHGFVEKITPVYEVRHRPCRH